MGRPLALTPLERAILRLARPGVSDREMASKIGNVRAQSVGRARNRLGIPPQGTRGVRKGTRSNPNQRGPQPLPHCWGCGKLAERCGPHKSLASQGWYAEKFDSWCTGLECYCRECIDTYGPPSVWAVDYFPKDEKDDAQ